MVLSIKKYNIKVIQKEVKENENGVQYAILRNTAVYKNVTGLSTQIYFTSRNHRYFITLQTGDAGSTAYNNIYNEIIQSINIED